ncbi:MAG: hypothetical protein KDJ19_07705 [Hyphomicrobiaceae bacterium]|nr:hypothetical protein [Hyphomicrobiaceae bacterium]MCC0024432.1 hypothetical protein [Hyphomicrobiaceae bacterium]
MALMGGVALASPVTFIERAPYDETGIDVAVDQSALHGILPEAELTDLVEAGRRLFNTHFTTNDGAGRPLATQATIPTHFKHPREIVFQRASGPDANACSSCHNKPSSGGAGDFTANVFTSEGTESADFDSVDPQFSNERNTNHMFGSGLMELLAREMTGDLHAQRDAGFAEAMKSGEPVRVDLVTKGISFGSISISPNGVIDVSQLDGVDQDLVVRAFSQKGVIPSLRMFTLNALNAHHGIEADERFGAAMTGEMDFDGDGVINELSPGLVSALVAYQATLPSPLPTPFDNSEWNAMAKQGSAVFAEAGCASCHVPALPLYDLKFADPGPLDSAGTLAAGDVPEPALYDLSQLDWVAALPRDENGDVLVPMFGDLKRHEIADDRTSHFGNELMSQGFVPRSTFITAELWGVADTAPYGHRGDLTTLDEAIRAHGGEAAASRDAYADLSEDDRNALLTFLKTLRMPQ